MATSEKSTELRRIAIVGGGVSGLGAAWTLHHSPDRFDFRLFEAQDRVGGNAVTADMPQDAGGSIPFDISVTALIPSVYHHILLLMEKFGIELIDTRFNYSVRYRGGIYSHDFDSDIREDLQSEIARFQRVLKRLHRFSPLTHSRSKLLNALNPFNYISMGTVLNLAGLSGEFTYIMHNQQPWADRSDKPCLVTYNPITPIDGKKIVERRWFQHIVHDVRHVTWLVPMFRFLQGRRRTWHCGAHTLINSQETCLVNGIAAARQLGADYPFDDPEARRSFNHYGKILHGWRFRKA